MSRVELAGVSVAYDGTPALRSADLVVESGEVVAVVGPSGCGKSTLLRAVAGLEPLTGGRIELDGRDLAAVVTHRRDVGLMFQETALFPHLDVAGNIAFGLRMQGRADGEQAARVCELLDLVGLVGFERRAIHQLSGGEAQRVALARALAPSPAVVMLDEPFGSLDRALREELTDELGRLLRRLGQTAIHVTHDQGEAFAIADRVVVLRDGTIVQEGAPAELWAEPSTAFVARFLGHPNVWTVDVGPDGAAMTGGHPLGDLGLPAGRHEIVVPVDAVSISDTGLVDAVVEAVRFHDGRYVVTTSAPAVVVGSPTPVAVGDAVRLAIDARSIRHLS